MRFYKFLSHFIVVFFLFTLTACKSTDTGQMNTAASGLLSGGLGYLNQKYIGGRLSNQTVASVSVIIGSQVAIMLKDQVDKQKAAEAENRALETGKPVVWRNPKTGNSGRVIPSKKKIKKVRLPKKKVATKPSSNKPNEPMAPVASEVAASTVCRDVVHEVTVDGKVNQVNGEACKDKSDGSWKYVG